MRPPLDLSLYLVTDTGLAQRAGRTVAETVAAAVAGGVTVVQVRDKEATTAELVQVLADVAAVLPAEVPLLVNDDVDAFLAARAAGIAVAGVHVGQDDAPVAEVRDRIGSDAILGVSASTPVELRAVDPKLVDYVGIGALHGTPTKPDAPAPLGVEAMIERARLAPVSAVAIGGIEVADAAALAGRGLAGVAVVSGIMSAPDPREAAGHYRSALHPPPAPARSVDFRPVPGREAGRKSTHLEGGRGRRVPRVLSIAGTDPTGGAGLQADLKSIAASGGYGMAVVTALVAQNTQGVRSVHAPPPEFLREQLDAVSDDVVIDAVKIGMLGDVATIDVVADWLDRVRPPIVVLDPVMVATSGDRLLAPEAEERLRELVSKADLITPNVPELAVLAGADPATDWDGVIAQARDVATRCGVKVLAKGGHLDGATVWDALVDPTAAEQIRVLSVPRVDTTATHGTGCSLSSAVATRQAATADWFVSIDESKQWLTESLRHGAALQVGQGHGPVSHFAGLWARGGLATSATAEWWHRIAGIREGTEADPFVASMVDGTLARDAFEYYLAQDVLYLHAYAEVLAATAALAADAGQRAFWERGVDACREEEQRLHQAWLGGRQVDAGPTTTAYVTHLREAVDAGYEQAIAAVLPCYWMYADLGERLVAHATGDHPYRDWLVTYGDPEFAVAARQACAIVDAVAASASPVVRDSMWQAFAASAQHERDFFAAPLALPQS